MKKENGNSVLYKTMTGLIKMTVFIGDVLTILLSVPLIIFGVLSMLLGKRVAYWVSYTLSEITNIAGDITYNIRLHLVRRTN